MCLYETTDSDEGAFSVATQVTTQKCRVDKKIAGHYG